MIGSAVYASAQWYHEPTPNDTLKSVRQMTDGSAVFSIYAPQAQKVSVAGDIFSMNPKTEKADNGVWTITIPDVQAGAFRYHFVVDGVNVYDPIAPEAKETSAVAIIGQGDEFFRMKDVPHGAIAQRYYYSKNLKATRRLHVWTPAGYEKSTESLPVTKVRVRPRFMAVAIRITLGLVWAAPAISSTTCWLRARCAR